MPALIFQNIRKGYIMWIEIFRAGKHTDNGGLTAEFSEADIDEIVRKYNAKDPAEQAPLVKGHPALDSPAHGWVERLARRGGTMLARIKNFSDEIVADINAGRFRRVSVALYPDMTLRHVGLLGAAAPAVSGLRPVRFSEFDNIKEYNFDINPAPEDEEKGELRTEIEKLKKTARLKEFREFASRQNISPASAARLVDALEAAYRADEANTGGGKSAVDTVKEFAREFSKGPEFGEMKQSAPANRLPARDFSGTNTPEQRKALHEKAVNLMNASPCLSYEEALLRAWG